MPIVAIGVVALLLVALAAALVLNNPSTPRASAPAPSAVGGLSPVATLQAADYHSLVVSPKDANTVWFGSHSGIQESNDGGATWHPLTGMSGDAMNMARPLADPAIVYIAGHDIFKRSADGGRTWQDVRSDLPGTDLHGFAVDPADAKHVYALVVGQGLGESADGGDHWQALPGQPPKPVGGLAVGPGSPAVIYVVTSSGVMRSPDGGKSWQPAGGGLAAGQEGARALLVVPGQPQELYAGTANGLYHTKDGGTSWQQVGLANQQIAALAASQSAPLRVYVLTSGGAVYRLEGSTLAR